MRPASLPILRFFGRSRLRMQYQTSAAECGLACLAMIFGHHGKRTDLSALRQSWPISMKGMTLAQIIGIAEFAGMSARPLRVELDSLGRLRQPCILHWNMDHFVVLERANARFAVILDPAIGRKKIPISEVSGKFSGVALELAPTSDFSCTPSRNTTDNRRRPARIGSRCSIRTTIAPPTPVMNHTYADDWVPWGARCLG